MMTADGFVLTGCEGSMIQGGEWNALPPPPNLLGVRPDACGIGLRSGQVALGEAKTWEDIDTPHTLEQLRILGYMLQEDGKTRCRLYVAVPRSAARDLDRVLAKAGLLGSRNIVRLHIPDCLIRRNPR